MRFGEDGRLYAINPEAGFFGVAPGTGMETNANAIKSLDANCIYTNVALTDDGDVWWEGLTDERPRTSSTGRATTGRPAVGDAVAAHPNARFTAPAGAVPVDRRRTGRTRPACRSPRSCSAAAAPPTCRWSTRRCRWEHGVFMGATIASEKTAAAEGTVGELRRDPFAMLPFCGYNMADYWGHWLKIGKATDARQAAADLPGQLVPQGRRRQRSCGRASARTAACSRGSSTGSRAWPSADETPIGRVPAARRPRRRRASTSTRTRWPSLFAGRPEHLAGRGRPDRRVLRQVRRQGPRRALRPARAAQDPPPERLTHARPTGPGAPRCPGPSSSRRGQSRLAPDRVEQQRAPDRRSSGPRSGRTRSPMRDCPFPRTARSRVDSRRRSRAPG